MIPKSDRRIIILLSMVAVVCVCVMIFTRAARVHETPSHEDGNYGNSETRKFGTSEIRNLGNSEVRNFGKKERVIGMFDPNTVDSITLTRYGLGPMQIHSLMSYRRHNGTFDKPLAVSRLYNWSDADVDKVLRYIRIGEKYRRTYRYREQYEEERESEYEHSRRPHDYRVYDRADASRGSDENADRHERKYDPSNKFTSLTRVDINTADTTLLKRVPGVGSGIANAIVKLRDKLGGFYKVEQLADLKFVSPELYEWFKVDSKPGIHLININKASFQTLNAHPYISYNQTRDLMNYRRLYGSIKDKDALLGTHIFSVLEVERLAPYLEY